MGGEAQVTEFGEYRLFTGWRSDPFFFNAAGAMNNMQFTGTDRFADKDVCSIVLGDPGKRPWRRKELEPMASVPRADRRQMGTGRPWSAAHSDPILGRG